MGVAMQKKRQTGLKKGSTTKAVPGKGATKVAPKKATAKVAPQKPVAKAVPKKVVSKVALTPIVAKKVVIQKNVIPVAEKPSALTCPLVLDGIISPEAFTPRDCRSCDEFDCRFYAVEERSSLLGSRLFACDEAGDEDGEDADLLDFGRGEDEAGEWGDEEEE